MTPSAYAPLLCAVLDCQPGDLLVYDTDPADLAATEGNGED
jgi:Cro/C1-type HTH DNA-binding domain